MARKKQPTDNAFVLFDVLYEDGARTSNRKRVREWARPFRIESGDWRRAKAPPAFHPKVNIAAIYRKNRDVLFNRAHVMGVMMD